jgi:hypothetical protein
MSTVSRKTCRRGKNMLNRLSQFDKPIRKRSVQLCNLANGIATSAFVLRPSGPGFRNPECVSGDVEDPGGLVNLEEQILCIAACGTRSNPI